MDTLENSTDSLSRYTIAPGSYEDWNRVLNEWVTELVETAASTNSPISNSLYVDYIDNLQTEAVTTTGTRETNNIMNDVDYNDLISSLAQRFGVTLKQADDTPAIPKNKKSYLANETTSRFSGAEWFKLIQTKNICLAGLGGIGSHTAFMLSRVHPASMTFYDDDIVEPANMSGQLFGRNDFNKNKGVAIAEMIAEYSDYTNVLVTGQKYTERSRPSDIMICGFDNMVARKTYYLSWKSYVLSLPEEKRKECLFIDGRLLMEEFQVLCIQGTDEYSMQRYEERFLFSDEEAEEPMCSMKQTSFCASMIGTVITNLFVNFVANQLNPIVPRDLPFYTSYNSTIMFFKTEA